LDIGTVRIASRNRQQSAFTLSADENETILNTALGAPSIGRKASDSGRHGSAEVRGRLEPLDVNNLVLHIAEHDIGSVDAFGVGIVASAAHAPNVIAARLWIAAV
jgi:hypothetical protein